MWLSLPQIPGMLCECVSTPLGHKALEGSGGGAEVRAPGASTSRGDGSLGQAQFGEASGEAEELLTQTEEAWGVEREMGQ